MLAASLLFVLLAVTGPLGRVHGVVLLLGLALFVVFNYREARAGQKRPPEPGELERVLGLPHRRRMITLFLVIGALMLPLGSDLLIDGATGIAMRLGVSESIIGLTVIAIGTSLPELATTLAAAFQRHAAVALGNVLGSNVVNLLLIMGVAAVLSPAPIRIPTTFFRLDLPVMLAAAAALSVFTFRQAAIGRAAGILLTSAYAVYLLTLIAVG